MAADGGGSELLGFVKGQILGSSVMINGVYSLPSLSQHTQVQNNLLLVNVLICCSKKET